MNASGDARRESGGREYVQITFVLASVLLGLVLAFMLGQFTARAPARNAVISGSGDTDPDSVLAENERAEEIQRLQTEVSNLKKQMTELKAEKMDLEGKLSIAADTVNRLTRSLQEEKRRADEAEWRASQSVTTPPPATNP